MTVDEAAERLQVATKTVRSWIAAGDLKAINVSLSVTSQKPRLRIMEKALEDFLTRRESTPNGKILRPKSRPPVKNYF